MGGKSCGDAAVGVEAVEVVEACYEVEFCGKCHPVREVVIAEER